MGFLTDQTITAQDPTGSIGAGQSAGEGAAQGTAGTQGDLFDPKTLQAGSLALGALGAGTGLYFGLKGKQQQQRALEMQQRAQQFAKSQALRQQREAAESIRRANRKQPDIAAILASAQGAGRAGIGSTFLSGLGGQKTPLGG